MVLSIVDESNSTVIRRGSDGPRTSKSKTAENCLTTDTDYDELAKELSEQEPGTGSPDPFADVDDQYADKDVDSAADAAAKVSPAAQADDLDEYAKWAAEAAAKATSGEFPASAPAAPAAPKPAPRKPIPMPMPSALKPKKS